MTTFAARNIALTSLTRVAQAYALFLPRNKSSTASSVDRIDPRQDWARKYLSWRYVRGRGIEIGALHQPLPLYHGAKARYLDRLPQAKLRKHYPELAKFELIEPEIIDDGETLESIGPESQDFIIANHFIEHCEDPIRAVENHISKLRTRGVLFLAVPMRDFTFDQDRPVTSIEHLVRDHEVGPKISRDEHYREWARLVHRVPEIEVDREAKRLRDENYSIHFHVWNFEAFEGFLRYLKDERRLKFSLCGVGRWKYNPFESVFVIRKG